LALAQRRVVLGVVVGLLAGAGAACEKKGRQAGQGSGSGTGTSGGGDHKVPPGVLAALVPMGARLEAGFSAVAGGADATRAFGDWSVDGDPEVGPAIVAAHGVSARLVGFELELIMGGKDANDYVRTMVHPTLRAQAFIALATSTDAMVDGVLLEQLTGQLAPVADSVRALLAVGADCSKLVVAPSSIVDQFGLPERLKQELDKMLTKARGATDAVCRLMAAHREPISVRLDDVAVAILDKQGQLVGGVRAQFETNDPGKLKLRLKKFEPPPPSN